MLSNNNLIKSIAFMARLYGAQVMQSPATVSLARTIYALAQLHMFFILLFVMAFSPLPPSPTLLDLLIVWAGSFACALIVYDIHQYITRGRTLRSRAHWIKTDD